MTGTSSQDRFPASGPRSLALRSGSSAGSTKAGRPIHSGLLLTVRAMSATRTRLRGAHGTALRRLHARCSFRAGDWPGVPPGGIAARIPRESVPGGWRRRAAQKDSPAQAAGVRRGPGRAARRHRPLRRRTVASQGRRAVPARAARRHRTGEAPGAGRAAGQHETATEARTRSTEVPAERPRRAPDERFPRGRRRSRRCHRSHTLPDPRAGSTRRRARATSKRHERHRHSTTCGRDQSTPGGGVGARVEHERRAAGLRRAGASELRPNRGVSRSAWSGARIDRGRIDRVLGRGTNKISANDTDEQAQDDPDHASGGS